MEGSHTPLYSLFGLAPERIMPAHSHVERVSDRREIHRGLVEPHRHPHLHQLTYWIAGTGEYQVETNRSAIVQGSLCWVPAGHIHGFSVKPRSDAIVFSLSRDHFAGELAAIAQGAGETVLRCPCVIPPDGHSGCGLAELFNRCELEFEQGAWAAQDVLSALARQALVVVGRYLNRLANIENTPMVRNDLFRRLEDCVEHGFRDHPTVAGIADELGSTPYLLNRACYTATGLQVSAFVRSRIMHEAQRLLLFTAIDIAEVAMMTGYADPSHFTRAFRAFHGETPRNWRERNTSG